MPNISIGDIFPTAGNTLPSEIKCYALPYGALGFVSHLLTYYTITCVCCGIRPYQPWKELQYSRFNLVLAILGLLGGVPLSIFTMVRCESTRPLLLMAIWKLTMSVTNGTVAIHAALSLRSARGTTSKDLGDDSENHPMLVEGVTHGDVDKNAYMWIAVYIIGVIIGSVGLIPLVKQHYALEPHLKTLTLCFGVPIAIMLVIGILFSSVLLGAGIVIAVTLYAFYSDWAIGLMAHNITGVPSSDVAPFYYAYFILKRLTMFSF